jgi:hypothetical protein
MMAKRTNVITDISWWQQNANRHFTAFGRTLREMVNLVGADSKPFAYDGPSFPLYTFPNMEWFQAIHELPRKAPEGISFPQEETELLLGKALRNT